MFFSNPPESYTTIPTRDPASTLSLIRALISAAPSKAHPILEPRVAKMHLVGVELQQAWLAANRPGQSPLSLGPYDKRSDRSWRAFLRRIQDWIDIDHQARAARAVELLELIAPTGADFLRLKYPAQWSEAERRLELITEDELETELVEMVGEAFMQELREAHAEYGEALGITAKHQPEAATRILEPLKAAHRAMKAYVQLVYALADEDDEQQVAAAEEMLEPVLRMRAMLYAQRSAGEGEQLLEPEPIDMPLPELPGAIGEGSEPAAQQDG